MKSLTSIFKTTAVVAVVALCVLVAYTIFRMINLCWQYVLVPFSDQYAIVEKLQSDGIVSFIFSTHNFHRMIYNNVFTLVDYHFFEWRNNFLFFAPLLCLLLCIYMFWRLFKYSQFVERLCISALSVSLYILPINWEGFWDPTQSSVIQPLLLFLLLNVLFIRNAFEQQRPMLIWLSAGFGILSALSFSYGLAVPFLSVLAMLWMRRWLQAAILFLMVAIFSFIDIFEQLQTNMFSPGGTESTVFESVARLSTSVLATLAVGSQYYITYDDKVGSVHALPLIGGGVLAVALVLTLWLVFTRRQTEAAPWIGLLLIALAGGLFIYIVRSSTQPEASLVQFATAPRYFIASYLAVLSILGMLQVALSRCNGAIRGLATTGMAVVTVLACSASLDYAQPDTQRFIRNWMGTNGASFMSILSSHFVPFLETGPGNVDLLAEHLSVARKSQADDKGPFSLIEAKTVGNPVSSLPGGASVPSCEGAAVVSIQPFVAQIGVIDATEIRVSFASATDRFRGGVIYLSDMSDTRLAAAGVTGLFADDRSALGSGANFAAATVLIAGSNEDEIRRRAVYYSPTKSGPFCRLPLKNVAPAAS